MNWEIVLNRLSHELLNFRPRETRDDVVFRPPANEFANQLRRHFTSIASHEGRHFKDHVAIGA